MPHIKGFPMAGHKQGKITSGAWIDDEMDEGDFMAKNARPDATATIDEKRKRERFVP